MAKQNVQNFHENSTRMKLNISIKAPDIVIPGDSKSLDAIILSLGHLIMSNQFLNLGVENSVGQPAIIDDLKLNLTDLKLMRVLLKPNYEVQFASVLLQPVSFHLWLKRNLSSMWYTDIPDIDIIAELQSIEVSCYFKMFL